MKKGGGEPYRGNNSASIYTLYHPSAQGSDMLPQRGHVIASANLSKAGETAPAWSIPRCSGCASWWLPRPGQCADR
jgi:hypothetical protein